MGSGISLCFWFALLWWLMMLIIFTYVYWSFVYLGRNVYLDSMPVFKLGYLFIIKLGFLGSIGTIPSSDMWFADIFSCFQFLHSIVSSTKDLVLMKSSFCFFCCCLCFWCFMYETITQLKVMKRTLVFSSKSFIVWALTFSPVIYFE